MFAVQISNNNFLSIGKQNTGGQQILKTGKKILKIILQCRYTVHYDKSSIKLFL